jgi:hypothetical protein
MMVESGNQLSQLFFDFDGEQTILALYTQWPVGGREFFISIATSF